VAPSNATKDNRFVKNADRCWVNIFEGVGCGEGTTSVNNAGEGMGCVPGHVTEEFPGRVDVVSESGEVMGLELICFEVTKGTLVATEVFLKIQVRLQSKCLLGGEESKKSGKEGTMELPRLWLGFLSLPANGGWFTLEFIMEGNESRLGGNKFGGMGGPCCPTVPKRSKNGIVEP
jgi:hypothetical protein